MSDCYDYSMITLRYIHSNSVIATRLDIHRTLFNFFESCHFLVLCSSISTLWIWAVVCVVYTMSVCIQYQLSRIFNINFFHTVYFFSFLLENLKCVYFKNLMLKMCISRILQCPLSYRSHMYLSICLSDVFLLSKGRFWCYPDVEAEVGGGWPFNQGSKGV